jgi:cob(I)alamin adenosyltransferase
MKIYTRKGDTGETGLLGGSRVSKANARIEAYGTVDELNSCLGLIRDSSAIDNLDTSLVRVQHQLFGIGSILASEGNSKIELPVITQDEVDFLEKEMDYMDAELPELRNFILPGGNLSASYCHLARCVCRRAERRVVSLRELSEVDEMIIHYLNRLSDYLFVLARFITLKTGGQETPWKPRS